jgi:hypothetical protein
MGTSATLGLGHASRSHGTGGTAIVSAGGIASGFSVSSGGGGFRLVAVVEPSGFVSGTATVGSGELTLAGAGGFERPIRRSRLSSIA